MINGNVGECCFAEVDFAALSSFTSEASLLGTKNRQPFIPANFLSTMPKRFKFHASGIVACTGTPTYTFQARLGSAQGSADLTGASVGVSAAITMQSGVTNRKWDLVVDVVLVTPGQGATACTLQCHGWVESFDGFASPFRYPLEPTTPPTATWTATINGAVTNYFNLSVTCSASNPSNAIQCKSLSAYSEN
jgi:hypothetical protein